jgi:hypothetical protein
MPGRVAFLSVCLAVATTLRAQTPGAVINPDRPDVTNSPLLRRNRVGPD